MSRPELLVLEATPRCPLRCRYCYNVWKAPGALPPEEASPERMRELALAVASARPRAVALAGGEPLLREDLEETARVMSGAGIRCGVVTCGVGLDRARARSLSASGVSWFEVALPSADRATFRELAGADALDDALGAMAAAVSAGALLSVSHVLTSRSPGSARGVADVALGLGARSVTVNPFLPGGEGFANARELSPSPACTLETLELMEERARGTGLEVRLGIPPGAGVLPEGSLPGVGRAVCACGESKWAVGPGGGLRVCEQSPVVLGSILEEPFRELASGPEARRFRAALPATLCRFRLPELPPDGGSPSR